MNYHSMHSWSAEIDEEWLLKSRLTYFTANKLFIGEDASSPDSWMASTGPGRMQGLHLWGMQQGSCILITWSILLSWQEGEAREAARRSKQVVKQSYEQIWGKDAWNTEKSRGRVIVGVPDLAKWWGENRSRSSDKAVCQLLPLNTSCSLHKKLSLWSLPYS